MNLQKGEVMKKFLKILASFMLILILPLKLNAESEVKYTGERAEQADADPRALCRGDRQRAGSAGPRRLCADGVPGETGAEEGEPGGL